MSRGFCYDFPIGRLGLVETDGALTRVYLNCASLPESVEERETPVLAQAAREIGEYCDGRRRSFDVPICLRGTEFQCRVWQALTRIPYGETATYGAIAAIVNSPRAARAVGLANNKNPLAIIIPCHRVVGSDGKLVGFAGGLEMKRRLLEIESAACEGGR